MTYRAEIYFFLQKVLSILVFPGYISVRRLCSTPCTYGPGAAAEAQQTSTSNSDWSRGTGGSQGKSPPAITAPLSRGLTRRAVRSQDWTGVRTRTLARLSDVIGPSLRACVVFTIPIAPTLLRERTSDLERAASWMVIKFLDLHLECAMLRYHTRAM